jgi:hypothetical protein
LLPYEEFQAEGAMNIIEQDFDIEEFLNRPLFAHLAALGEAGPCETPVWFSWEDGALWIIATSKGSFARRLLKDERAAIGIVDFDLKRGFLQHLGMRGVATVLPMAVDRRTRLVTRYLGNEATWNSWFKANVVERQDVLVKFVPDTVFARDQSYFRRGDPTNKVEKNPSATEQLTQMLDHVSFGVSDLPRSIAFYDSALAGIGYFRIWTTVDAAVISHLSRRTEMPCMLSITPRSRRVP